MTNKERIANEYKNRKAQEEIVGFVLIVVLVAIIFLVLLGLFLKGSGSGTAENSNEVNQFLESAMGYTTTCAIDEPNYLSVGELIGGCGQNSGNSCTNGENVCKVANSTMVGLLDVTWKISKEGQYKGYQFVSSLNQSGISKKIVEVNKGNCSSKYIGHSYSLNDVTSTLKVCF